MQKSDLRAPLGFVGLGIMGRPMVRRLLAAGHVVQVYSRSSKDVDVMVDADADAVPESSACSVAEAAGIVMTLVPNTPQVEEVVLGPQGDHPFTS